MCVCVRVWVGVFWWMCVGVYGVGNHQLFLIKKWICLFIT